MCVCVFVSVYVCVSMCMRLCLRVCREGNHKKNQQVRPTAIFKLPPSLHLSASGGNLRVSEPRLQRKEALITWKNTPPLRGNPSDGIQGRGEQEERETKKCVTELILARPRRYGSQINTLR